MTYFQIYAPQSGEWPDIESQKEHEMVYPPELSRYIEKQQKLATDANQADHKPTYDTELGGIATRLTSLYDLGQALIATLSVDDIKQSRGVFLLDYSERDTSYVDELIEEGVLGQLVLVPRHITLVERIRKYRPVFT